MPTVELMRPSARKDVLPPRCVITGATQNVSFHRVWVPSRLGWAVRLDLPFAVMAFRRWNASWLLFYLSIFLAAGSFIAGIIIAAFGGIVAPVVYLSAVVLPLGAWSLLVRSNGPEVVRQRREAVVLYVPSEEAAREMQSAIDEFEYRETFRRLAATRKKTPPAPVANAPADAADRKPAKPLEETGENPPLEKNVAVPDKRPDGADPSIKDAPRGVP